jgi:hypothetical protein
MIEWVIHLMKFTFTKLNIKADTKRKRLKRSHRFNFME